MKKWGWKNWLMFGIFAALCVTSLVMVIVFVAIEPSPTVLQVCWHPDGRVQYTGGGWEDEGMPEDEWICDAPEGLVWPQGDALTLRIVDHAGAPLDGSGDESSVVDAMDLMNDALDTHMTFVQGDEADITFMFRAAFEVGEEDHRASDRGGWCIHSRAGGTMSAEAAIRPAGNSRVEYRRAAHELGHCFGLAHSRVGLMREGDLDDSSAERMEMDRISDGQRALMRQVYP